MTVYTINEWRPKECSSYMIIKIIDNSGNHVEKVQPPGILISLP